jgi:hypothetical protein
LVFEIFSKVYYSIQFYETKEFNMPTKKTNAIHKEAPEKIVFLLLDHPSGDASTTGTPITNKNDVTIKASTAN